ncbi:hypothetical protein RRF57_007550 [Xylaria bambusicola]|uniref:DUF7918 domain-containing protein n=1 Tax=Xylaria bambusicola TaxID=326684 RepID=A0AAN7ZAI0_9PEZI
MAVIEDVPGIEVTVLVDRKKAIEYEADDELKRSLTKHACPTATKYIESINDASFSIRLDARRDYAWGYKKHALVFETDVDGDFISSKVLSSPKTKTIDGKKRIARSL